MPGQARKKHPRAPRPEPRPGFVAVGYVRAPRGVRGEFKVEPLSDIPERFLPTATLWAGGVQHTVRASRQSCDTLLLQLDGVDTREQAESLRGLLFEVPETESPALAEGTYFHHQIVGLEVRASDGESLGRVASILETGANDVYVVRSEAGELLIPAIDSVIRTVDLARGVIIVSQLDGMERRRKAK